jgi:DNA-binding NtrC family response regulator
VNHSQLRKISLTTHTVLITGRTGTGKSHLARKIHDWSGRKDSRFVCVNLATLSENLIESELFGHEKGAFSGADMKRVGKLESGNGGTIFLDEIGELPPRLQTKLLEALNSQTICPVGSNREIRLDIRIVAATNRDLVTLVQEGLFREDLYFRLNTFEIGLADLATEPQRIGQLARDFLHSAAAKANRTGLMFSPEIMATFESHPWPGNVRELKNCIDYMVAMSNELLLQAEHLPTTFRKNAQIGSGNGPNYALPTDYREAKSYFEKTYLEEILARFAGKINLTAKRTGLSKVTLIDKIRRYEIDVASIKYQAHMKSNNIAEAV